MIAPILAPWQEAPPLWIDDRIDRLLCAIPAAHVDAEVFAHAILGATGTFPAWYKLPPLPDTWSLWDDV